MKSVAPLKPELLEVLLSSFSARLAQPTNELPSTRCIIRSELISLLGEIKAGLNIPGARSMTAEQLLELLRRSGLIKPVPITPLSSRIQHNRFFAVGLDADPEQLEPAEILQAHIPDGVICYFTALQLHGLTTQPAPHHHIAKISPASETSSPMKAAGNTTPPPIGNLQFEFQGIRYFQSKRDARYLQNSQFRYLNSRSMIRVTTLEQTLVDTLHRPMNAGGPSIVFEAWEAGAGTFDAQRLINIVLKSKDLLLARRTGYMLEQVLPQHQRTIIEPLQAVSSKNLTETSLESHPLFASIPYKTLNARWNLLVP